MSTNFFAHVNICNCCGKPEKVLHIGKRFAAGNGQTGFIFKEESEFDPQVSALLWQDFARLPQVKVFDEFGNEADITSVLANTNKAFWSSELGEFC